MPETVAELTEAAFQQLQQETFVLLGTIDAENGWPTSSAISWVYAADRRTLRFAIDQKSRIVANIKNNSKVTVTLFSSGTVYALYGEAAVAQEPLADVPLKLACIDIKLDQVRDAMFYGSRITVGPEYEKTYDKRAADRLDNQVFTAMKKA